MMKKKLRLVALVLVLSLCVVYVFQQARFAASAAGAQGARSAGVLYAKNCASCHGKDGRAKTFKARFNKARDLTDPDWQSNVSDERIFNSITNGRGKKMPAYGQKFTDAEINALVTYVRNLRK